MMKELPQKPSNAICRLLAKARQSAWCIITGPPCAGKTTLIERLAQRGFTTVPEAARRLIEQQRTAGKSLVQLKATPDIFEARILKMKIDHEHGLPPDKTVFFDRGIPDSIVYYQIEDLPIDPVISACLRFRYRKVFFLDPVAYAPDDTRRENEDQAQWIATQLRHVYGWLGYRLIDVPVMPVDNRVKFVLSRI